MAKYSNFVAFHYMTITSIILISLSCIFIGLVEGQETQENNKININIGSTPNSPLTTVGRRQRKQSNAGGIPQRRHSSHVIGGANGLHGNPAGGYQRPRRMGARHLLASHRSG